jgi:hypothetical protein
VESNDRMVRELRQLEQRLKDREDGE